MYYNMMYTHHRLTSVCHEVWGRRGYWEKWRGCCTATMLHPFPRELYSLAPGWPSLLAHLTVVSMVMIAVTDCFQNEEHLFFNSTESLSNNSYSLLIFENNYLKHFALSNLFLEHIWCFRCCHRNFTFYIIEYGFVWRVHYDSIAVYCVDRWPI